MKQVVWPISEEEMVAILQDALRVYLPEVRAAWSFDGTCRSCGEFARDYVVHLYSTWQPKGNTMKTAAQIRELMMASHSQILKQIECEIEDAAREGRSEVEIFINQQICNWPTAQAIVDELIDNGYKAKREFIADQRDGDCVKFEIKW